MLQQRHQPQNRKQTFRFSYAPSAWGSHLPRSSYKQHSSGANTSNRATQRSPTSGTTTANKHNRTTTTTVVMQSGHANKQNKINKQRSMHLYCRVRIRRRRKRRRRRRRRRSSSNRQFRQNTQTKLTTNSNNNKSTTDLFDYFSRFKNDWVLVIL
jgi:hypothetical protein